MSTSITLALRAETTELARHVATGLHQVPKALSSMYFYDDAGSRLFQQIMALPEYYPTRAEFVGVFGMNDFPGREKHGQLQGFEMDGLRLGAH